MEDELKDQLKAISDEELAEMARTELSKLCKTGGKSFSMTIPARYDDTDIIFYELLERFNH